MVTAIYLSLVNFDFALAGGRQDQRRRPVARLRRGHLAANWIGTAIGIVLVFIPCLASSLTPRFLGGPSATSFGMSLGLQFGETGTWALGSAMGVVLFVASLLVILVHGAHHQPERSGFTGARTP